MAWVYLLGASAHSYRTGSNFLFPFGDPKTITREGIALKLSARGGSPTNSRKDRPLRGDEAGFVSYDDLTAFDEFIETIGPELRRFIQRKVRPEAVDDVLQEVWLAAWQALPGYDRRSTLRTWIYGICVHKCHDRYRAQGVESRLVPLAGLSLIDTQPSPEDAAVRTDTVNRLLGELDENQRIVLELYYYAQLTLAEIATALDRNLNTVKYQFYRAHSELLEKGEKEGLR